MSPSLESVRIAMWSGPRNISTALMRSFENRPDTVVVDEPLYAHYLAVTGKPHPGRDEVLARCETDWRVVTDQLAHGDFGDARIVYQKHMAHHLLPGIDHGWLGALRHVFLIRDPREMLLSLSKVTPHPTLEDTGLPQQVALYEEVSRWQSPPPAVLDAKDVLSAPRAALTALCSHLEIPFDDAMLAWPPGPRPTDGVWAPHWYAAVERSTGFEPWRPREGDLPPSLEPVLAACQEPYAFLAAHRLRTP